MKKSIDVFDYSAHILKSLASGILLTTSDGSRVNTMTIAWGMLGIDWRLPVFITFVRSSRLSHEFLQANPQFTINVPVDSADHRILAVAGTRSGREMDKIREMNLHLEAPLKISVPGIREFPLTLECNVIYQQAQNPEAIPMALREAFHPASATDLSKVLNCTYHTAFYGEIVAAYIIGQ